jgi:hypothetical protein
MPLVEIDRNGIVIDGRVSDSYSFIKNVDLSEIEDNKIYLNTSNKYNIDVSSGKCEMYLPENPLNGGSIYINDNCYSEDETGFNKNIAKVYATNGIKINKFFDDVSLDLSQTVYKFTFNSIIGIWDMEILSSNSTIIPSERLPIDANFKGNPTTTTQSVDDESTKIATTQYVVDKINETEEVE